MPNSYKTYAMESNKYYKLFVDRKTRLGYEDPMAWSYKSKWLRFAELASKCIKEKAT